MTTGTTVVTNLKPSFNSDSNLTVTSDIRSMFTSHGKRRKNENLPLQEFTSVTIDDTYHMIRMR